MPEPSAASPSTLDTTIARLRLLLADITAREAAIEHQHTLFRDQREKLIHFSLYGNANLDSVLAMLGDVEERIAQVEAGRRALRQIRGRAETELESLQLTKRVAEAKAMLGALRAQQAASALEGGAPAGSDELQAEIARLQALIHEASERAARAIGKAMRRV